MQLFRRRAAIWPPRRAHSSQRPKMPSHSSVPASPMPATSSSARSSAAAAAQQANGGAAGDPAAGGGSRRGGGAGVGDLAVQADARRRVGGRMSREPGLAPARAGARPPQSADAAVHAQRRRLPRRGRAGSEIAGTREQPGWRRFAGRRRGRRAAHAGGGPPSGSPRSEVDALEDIPQARPRREETSATGRGRGSPMSDASVHIRVDEGTSQHSAPSSHTHLVPLVWRWLVAIQKEKSLLWPLPPPPPPLGVPPLPAARRALRAFFRAFRGGRREASPPRHACFSPRRPRRPRGRCTPPPPDDVLHVVHVVRHARHRDRDRERDGSRRRHQSGVRIGLVAVSFRGGFGASVEHRRPLRRRRRREGEAGERHGGVAAGKRLALLAHQARVVVRGAADSRRLPRRLRRPSASIGRESRDGTRPPNSSARWSPRTRA